MERRQSDAQIARRTGFVLMGRKKRKQSMLDLMLAILHHLMVFSLVAVVLAEFVSVRHHMEVAAIARVATLDLWYGVLAGLILIVGFSRALFAAKGWYYYEHNLYFWAKIATFAAIGLLSIPPTLTYLRWRRTNLLPTGEEVAKVRRYLLFEILLFAPLLGFAAAMARGYGEF
jgi:putative membrane protein